MFRINLSPVTLIISQFILNKIQRFWYILIHPGMFRDQVLTEIVWMMRASVFFRDPWFQRVNHLVCFRWCLFLMGKRSREHVGKSRPTKTPCWISVGNRPLGSGKMGQLTPNLHNFWKVFCELYPVNMMIKQTEILGVSYSSPWPTWLICTRKKWPLPEVPHSVLVASMA